MEDLSDAIGSGGLSASQKGSLGALLQNVGTGDGTNSYVYFILGEVVASARSGTTQMTFNTLIDQWFLGTDDPTPLSGSQMVSEAGSVLFPTAVSTAYQYVDQGYTNGDCWLVAALVETDAVDPTGLQSMIWENANGTYGVRYCSPGGYVYLTVNADLMNNDNGAYCTDDAIWAGLFEKAFVEAQADGISFPMSDGTSFTTTYANSYQTVANGGWDEMMEALTGRQTNYYQLNSQSALTAGGWIYNNILTDTENGIDVMFDSNTTTAYGLEDDHMFAVIGVDQSTGDYILFNPWGYAETSNAKFEVSPGQLYSLYRSGSGDEFLAADGAYYFTENALCQLAGTRIATPLGERPIENLRIGDAVVTRFNGVQRIKWIGEQQYAGRSIAGNREKIPVKIAAGALGENLPRRDLVLSPGHSLLLDGILVLAKDLLNGVTITQDWLPEVVSYYNIELAAHDCVLAEGVWSESFADCADMRRAFHNAESYWRRYPATPAPLDPVLCAARPRSGAALTKILSRVLRLAEARMQPGPTLGFVEQIGAEVTGWAFDPEHPDLPLRLEVYAGRNLVGECLAHRARADLAQAGFGAGRCGFNCELPPGIYPAIVSVRRAGSGEILPTERSLVLGRAA